MSAANAPSAQQKYYDPAEVETYVRDVTNTIEALQARLQQALRRAERAEQGADQGSGDQHPETASLGRALLLAGEVADKTIADADVRANEILRAAEARAAAIVEAAQVESRRLVEAAGDTAAEVFEKGEARLLAAVSAFVEGSNVLRTALARIEDDATSWRRSLRPPQPPEPPPYGRSSSSSTTTVSSTPSAPPVSSPYAVESPEDATPGRPPMPPEMPEGVRNRAGSNGYRSTTGADPGLPDPPSRTVAPNPSYPPPPPSARLDDLRGDNAG